MTFDPKDLVHDADGGAVVPAGSRTLDALNGVWAWLFRGEAPRTTGPLTANGLTRRDCQRRFRWRVAYPAAAVLSGIPIILLVAGGLGAMSRGTLEEDLPGLLSVAGFAALGGFVLAVVLIPAWQREYRVRVTDVEPDNLSVQADAQGLSMSRDGQVTCQAPWSRLSLVAVRLQETTDGRLASRSGLVALILADDRGRQESVPLYGLDRGHQMARRILTTLVEKGRLRRA